MKTEVECLPLDLIDQGFEFLGVLGPGISNYDGGSITEGLEERLKAGKVIAQHSAWEFCGYVYWDGERFVELVDRYQETVAAYTADSLRELMAEVNDDWGWG